MIIFHTNNSEAIRQTTVMTEAPELIALDGPAWTLPVLALTCVTAWEDDSEEEADSIKIREGDWLRTPEAEMRTS